MKATGCEQRVLLDFQRRGRKLQGRLCGIIHWLSELNGTSKRGREGKVDPVVDARHTDLSLQPLQPTSRQLARLCDLPLHVLFIRFPPRM